jgi:hypothetical protein
MPWNFAYSSLDRRWAVLHDHVVVANKQPLQKGELIKDAHDWFFFTESNVTVAWLGTLLRYELAEREKPAAKREMGRRESSPRWRWVICRKRSNPRGREHLNPSRFSCSCGTQRSF